MVQCPWGVPSSLAAPNGLDKKLYCSAPNLQELLQLPSVDAPVAHLTSSSVLTNDIADCLQMEDRKAELVLCINHQAAAWAIKAATSASFFNRASLIWLRQLQDHLPPEDKRLHQDINKLMAATEYSANTSLDATKFTSRALTSAVTSGHLLWLYHWRADIKSEWKLASAPFKGSNIFGAALDPILEEDKDKRADCQYTPYSQRQPFRTDIGPSGSYSHRPYSQGFDKSSDRSTFRERDQRQPPVKRPFRGMGNRPFRRGK